MKTALTACLSLGLAVTSLHAQSAETPPVGFNTVECLPNSDTYCGVPFARPAVFQGIVSTVQTGAGTLTLTPEGTPAWTANAFQTLFMVRIISGTKAGMYYQVTANTDGTVTVDLAGDTSSGIAAGDSFRIHPFWTLSTLFPPATQTTVVPSTGTLANQRRTEILLPDIGGTGTNLAPISRFYILGTVQQWRKVGDAAYDANSEILWPDSYFTVRHAHSTIVNSTYFTAVGTVETNSITTPLATRSSGSQDNFVVSGRPIPVKLSDLGLISSNAFMASTSTLANGRRDVIFVFDNSIAILNKAPSATYYYFSGNWRKVGDANPANDDVILPSHGIIIRKYTSDGSTKLWTNNLQ